MELENRKDDVRASQKPTGLHTLQSQNYTCEKLCFEKSILGKGIPIHQGLREDIYRTQTSKHLTPTVRRKESLATAQTGQRSGGHPCGADFRYMLFKICEVKKASIQISDSLGKQLVGVGSV